MGLSIILDSVIASVGMGLTFHTFLRWPVRTISFNYTGDYIASASEDLFIDIVSIRVTFPAFLFLRSVFSLCNERRIV